jgi:type IV secretory pathway VirB10-like protein
MRNHHRIVLCAALGFGAGFYIHSINHQKAPNAESMSTRTERAPAQVPIETRLQSTPADFVTARAMVAGSPADSRQQLPTREVPSDAVNAADPRASLEEERAKGELRWKEHVAAVAASFAREARDQRWSNEVAESLRATFGSEELAAATVQSIDCRTSTCRVEVQDDGSGKLPMIVPMLAVQMAGSLPNLVAEHIDQPNGKMMMVLYMSR